MLDRIVMYLVQARYYLESSLAISMGIFLVALLLMWIISRYGLKRKMKISIKNMIITYLLLLYIIVIYEWRCLWNDGYIVLGILEVNIFYKYQRNGYAFEILSNLIEVIHERYKNYEIVAMTDKENEASINLLKKLGFVNEGYEERVESYIFSLYAD